MINPLFLRTLANLNLPKNKHAIYGSGPLGIRGIRDCRDLDVVVTDDLYRMLMDKLPQVEPGKLSAGDGVEIISGEFSKIKNFEEVINRAEEISGFKFILLSDLVEWKTSRGREKDLRDIELINKFLFKKHKNNEKTPC